MSKQWKLHCEEGKDLTTSKLKWKERGQSEWEVFSDASDCKWQAEEQGKSGTRQRSTKVFVHRNWI